MGELLFPYIDPVETPNNGYMRLGLRSHTKGTFHSFVDAGKELEATKMHRVAKDKFILNITFAWEHAVAVTDEKDEGKLVSHRFPQFSFSPCLAPIFLKFLILDKKFKDYLELCSPGGAGRNRVLKIQEMLKYEIKIPKSTKEQTAIGNFFKQLDETIALHQRQIEKYQKLKIGFLQSIFCSKISLNQEKNTNAWEQRKLGEVGKAQSGIGFPDKEQQGKTGIPFYKVSDMNKIGNEVVMSSANNYVTQQQISKNGWHPISSTPTIIFAKVGAALMLNRKRLVLNEFLIDNNTMAYIFNDSWDPYFGKILFDTIYLPKLSQVGALPSFNGSDLENLEIKRPRSKEEQTAIGNFFKQLDETIALHQRKIEKCQFIKQLYLERMLIK